jgi:hypothetical protein
VALSDCDHKGAFRIRLASILELEKCLTAAFSTLSHAHACVPHVIDAFTTLFQRYAVVLDATNATPTIVLAACSLDPLTRLRIAIDNHVAFRPRDAWSDQPLEVLRRCFNAATPAYRSAVVETFGAPTLEVVDDATIVSSPVKTGVSFVGIVVSALRLLQQPLTRSPQVPLAVEFTGRCLRIHCYDILRHQCLASVRFRISNEVTRSVFSMEKGSYEMDTSETHARCLAIVQYSGNIFIATRREPASKAGSAHFVLVVQLILRLFESDILLERTIGCHAVCSLLAFAIEEGDHIAAGKLALDGIYASITALTSSRSLLGIQ